MGPKFLLVDVSCSKIFSRGSFVGPSLFLVVISWIQKFFLVEILWSSFAFLEANFMTQRISVIRCMKKSVGIRKHINTSHTAYFFPNQLQQIVVLFIIRKILDLLN